MIFFLPSQVPFRTLYPLQSLRIWPGGSSALAQELMGCKGSNTPLIATRATFRPYGVMALPEPSVPILRPGVGGQITRLYSLGVRSCSLEVSKFAVLKRIEAIESFSSSSRMSRLIRTVSPSFLKPVGLHTRVGCGVCPGWCSVIRTSLPLRSPSGSAIG